MRNLNLGFNKLHAQDLKPLAKLKALRVLYLENNELNGMLDLDDIGLGEKNMPELASLVLSGNAGLRGTTGAISRGGKIETDGYLLEISSMSAPGTDSSKATLSAGSVLPISLPTMTLMYRTLPAATFDSLPLDIEFDLYLPSRRSSGAGHPLVIWFHGGGLLQGNKENLPPHLRRLPGYAFGEESVAVISPNYRLAPQVPILDILDDITVLLSFIRTKLNDRLDQAGKDEHRVDTSRICLSGGSAGAYLALITGLEMPKSASNEEVGGYRGDGGIRCIAPFCPITDLTDNFWTTEVDRVAWMSKRYHDLASLVTIAKRGQSHS